MTVPFQRRRSFRDDVVAPVLSQTISDLAGIRYPLVKSDSDFVCRLVHVVLSVFALLSSVVYPLTASARFSVTHLRVEQMAVPACVDTEHPRFSWINLPSTPQARGESQSAYQICVAGSCQDLMSHKRLVWDTGKRLSSDSYLISYGGMPLQSGHDYWWRVRTWDQQGKVSAWSAPSHWGMGLLNPSDWKAQWIGADFDSTAPLFRKSFVLPKPVKKAKVFICGLGYFELYANGQRIGDDCLVPNFTNYTQREGLDHDRVSIDGRFTGYRVNYLAYDVTDVLRAGSNALGVVLGNGFYNCDVTWTSPFGKPCLLVQLQIDYRDGTHDTIVSDTTWRSHASAILCNGPYAGEVYDARREVSDWAGADGDESGWQRVKSVPGPNGRLTAQTSPSDKVTEILDPVQVKALGAGCYEVDFGKEISGWVRFNHVTGREGDTLNVKYVCESPLGTQQYIFADHPASWAPRFTWYVFRKAIVSGLSRLEAGQIQADAVNTDVPVDAEFASSNALFEQIVNIWLRSQTDNMHGCIASDCPHRERSPYTGDGQVSCAMVMDYYDAAAFYRKWIRDIMDCQDPSDGYVPNGAPWQPGCGGGVAWGAAMNIMPWEYYLHYGDKEFLKECYEPMKKHVANMLTWMTPWGTMYQQMREPGRQEPCMWLNLGEWAPSYGLPKDELVHTFYLWLCLYNTAQASGVLGRSEDHVHYTQLAESVKQAFHKRFYDPKTHSYGDFGSNIFALRMGVPEEVRSLVIETLHKEIVEKYHGHLNTGMLGTRYFFEVLSDYGLHDIAYAAMNKTDFPSYGNWISQGATTTWEQWDGRDSHNHPMFGGGLTWMGTRLCGVRLDASAPAYRHVVIDPILSDSLSWASYCKQTPYGQLLVTVENQQSEIKYHVTIPVGSSASLRIPASSSADVKERGLDLVRAGLRYKVCDGELEVRLAQGNYYFQIHK